MVVAIPCHAMSTRIQLRSKTVALVIGGLIFALVLVFTVTHPHEPPPVSITGVASTNVIEVRSRAMAGRVLVGRVMDSSSTNAAALRLRANPLRDGIEAAERHNLFWMQRYQQQMLRRINSDLSMPPDALPSSPLDVRLDRTGK